MIIRCSACDIELSAPGALVFGPPDSIGMCVKSHLCHGCYAAFQRAMTRTQRFVRKKKP